MNKTIKGTSERPRLTVYRSLNNMFVQIIDDSKAHTILGISSISMKQGRCNIKLAERLGEMIAEKAQEKGIKKVVFDRAGKLYHGRIRAVADGARKKGLEF